MAPIEQADRLQVSSFSELAYRKPAAWIVRDVLREESVSMWYGQRGCYKSFLALDLSAHLATGQTWHGQEVTRKGLVIYIAAEGAGGMAQRTRAWAEAHGVMPGSVNIKFITEPVVITGDSPDTDLLIDRIRDAIDWQDEGFDLETGYEYTHPVAREWPVLIVIDTLARCFVGNENSQEDMARFIQGVDRLKREFACSVLFIHHSGRKDKSHARGSTVHEASADTVFAIDKLGTSQKLKMTNDKMKDGRDGHVLRFAYDEHTLTPRLGDTEPLTSVVITDAPTVTASSTPLVTVDRIESLLEEHVTLDRDELLELLEDVSEPNLRKTLNRYKNSRFTLKGQTVSLAA